MDLETVKQVASVRSISPRYYCHCRLLALLLFYRYLKTFQTKKKEKSLQFAWSKNVIMKLLSQEQKKVSRKHEYLHASCALLLQQFNCS
jgi:hypothetical protein